MILECACVFLKSLEMAVCLGSLFLMWEVLQLWFVCCQMVFLSDSDHKTTHSVCGLVCACTLFKTRFRGFLQGSRKPQNAVIRANCVNKPRFLNSYIYDDVPIRVYLMLFLTSCDNFDYCS